MTQGLRFGTAGIRAAMGDGPERLNETSIARIVRAVLEVARGAMASAQERGVCIGYDGRERSARFAEVAAHQAGAAGFRACCFQEPVPTPLVAFTARQRRSSVALMITASHNPPGDNGVKVYFDGGGQLGAPHDRHIAALLESGACLPGAAPPSAPEPLGGPEEARYLAALERLAAAVPRGAAPLVLAYSALSGVGSKLTRALLGRTPHRLVEVAAQSAPRPDLGGLANPNPEHAAALEAVLGLCATSGADLALAHDPDADRLAVAVGRGAAAPLRLSGDEVGTLLAETLLGSSPAPQRELLATSHVSSAAIDRVVAHHGAHLERTPTGFKWIVRCAEERASRAGLRFGFGYEEAIGYAFPTLSGDKDGLAALALITARAAALKAEGASLLDELGRLAVRDGLHASAQVTITLDDAERDSHLARLEAGLRGLSPAELVGSTDAVWHDLGEGLKVLEGASGGRVCVRPSGTEPKLKVYLHSVGALHAASDFLTARAQALEVLRERGALIARLAAET